jgi:hypothetical protein
MKALVLSAYPAPHDFTAKWLIESAGEDPFKVHCLAPSADEADLILFAEGHTAGDQYYFSLRRHPIWRRHRQKCFLYHDEDYVVPLAPGLYPALNLRDRDPAYAIGAPYMARLAESPVRGKPSPPGPDALLYSFIGSTVTHSVRREIMKLAEDDRAHCEDTGTTQAWSLSPEDRAAYFSHFAVVTARSKFVLCPRGNSPSTYRLFETMEMGRVPVIVSDAFTPFEGPDWRSFSLHIGENETARIPELLRQSEPLAEEMGLRARVAWELWIAKPVCFHRTIEACQSIMLRRSGAGGRATAGTELRFRYVKELLEPFHLKNLVRWVKGGGLQRLRRPR